MEKIQINGFVIDKLSKEDISSYFETAFNNPKVKDIFNSSSSTHEVKTRYQYFGNILQAYVTATGDVSEQSIEKLAQDFKEHSDKIKRPIDRNKLEGEQVYFADHVMPLIIEKHKQKLNLDDPLNLEQQIEILKSIKLNCFNNRFHTHSFNGALLEEINAHGLDINKEMFQDEFNQLKQVGLFQAFQKGNLLFCELSKASFGYALYSPERLYMTMSDHKEQQDDQSIHQFLLTSLNANLSAKNLSPVEYQKNFSAGKKMIDFYFAQDQGNAIAFKPCSNEITTEPPGDVYGHFKFALGDYFLKLKVERFCDKKGDEELKEKFASAINDLKTKDKIDTLDKCIEEFNTKYPDNGLFEEPLQVALKRSITQYCLNNFTYNGCADGYKIESGTLERNQFSIAHIPNPIDGYVANKQALLAIEKEKYMAAEYNEELYNQKYMLEIKSGRQPAESFEDYCKHNQANTHFLTAVKGGVRVENPKYTQWKQQKGYKDPNSPASLALIEKIKKAQASSKSSSMNIGPSKTR